MVAVILLDTHAWIWWVSDQNDRIPKGLDQWLRRTPETVAVASVSCLEVAMLQKKGRITLSCDLISWFELALSGSGIELLPLTPGIAAESAALPDIHRDPVDRVIIATALAHDAVLVSRDTAIAAYPGVRVVWDAPVTE